MIFFFWFSIMLTFSHFVDNSGKRQEFQNNELKMNCKKMFNRIKMMAKEQLGLEKFNLEQLEIEDWPRFVSLQPRTWSELALRYLENALPSMIFRLKKSSDRNEELSERCKKRQLLIDQKVLYAMLLKKFKEASCPHKNDNRCIPWKGYNVKGWPNGICFNSVKWKFSDLLEIYHCINGITWEPVKTGSMRTCTYTDGTIKYFDLKKRLSYHNADSAPENKKSNIIIDQSEEVEKQDDDDDEDEEEEEEEDDHVVLEVQNQDMADNIPQIEPADEHKSLDLFFAEYTECANADGHEQLDIQCDDLESKREKMYKRIKKLAKEQGMNSLILCDFNEMEGWPRFVGFLSSSWSELALQYLEEALPLMKFKPRNSINSSHSNSEKQKNRLGVDRVDTAALLLKKYNEEKGHQEIRFKFIPWKFCHVRGWPVGVAFDSKLWKYSDILAIRHNINGISWESVKVGEPSTVTYTDGTTVERVSQKRFIDHENANTGKRLKIQDDPVKETESQDYECNDEENEKRFFDEFFS